jgi:hypothetical protein
MSKISIAASLAAVLAAGILFSAPTRAESVMKECGAEWKTAKDNKTTNGQTWREFLKDCRTRHAGDAATPASAAPAPAPAPVATPAAAPAPAPTPTHTRMAKVEPSAPAAGEFASEGEAKGHCPSDTVVWVNTKSHKYHYAGNRSYGTTKRGAYMCEADAKSAGDVAAHNEKPKT